jgi:hypothetical protein
MRARDFGLLAALGAAACGPVQVAELQGEGAIVRPGDIAKEGANATRAGGQDSTTEPVYLVYGFPGAPDVRWSGTRYVVSEHWLMRTRTGPDGIVSWQRARTPLSCRPSQVWGAGPQELYLGYGPECGEGAGLWVTRDEGDSWMPYLRAVPTGDLSGHK